MDGGVAEHDVSLLRTSSQSYTDNYCLYKKKNKGDPSITVFLPYLLLYYFVLLKCYMY